MNRGLVAVNLAVVFFGMAGVLAKLIAFPSPDIVFGRVLIAGAALMGLGLTRDGGLRVHSRADLALLAAQGIILAIHWTVFFQSILVSSVAIALLSYSCFPLFTAIFEGWVLNEPVRRVEVVGAFFVLPGVALLVPNVNVTNHVTSGVLWGILAGLTFAILSIVNRRLSQRYDSQTISAYQDAIASVVLFPFVLALPVPRLTVGNVALLLALGLVCTAVAHTLFIEGLRTVSTPLASLFAAMEPVWGIALGVALLGELPDFREFVGGSIILTALVLPAVASIKDLPVRGSLARSRGREGSR